MSYSAKVLDHYENPRNVGSFEKDDDAVGTGMVGAPACGDVMKLRFGNRVELARHRMGEGQDARSGHVDQEHADRRRIGAAAGEDPLLDPRGRRDQGSGRRLQATPR
jgi:hypothetical protein